LQRLPRRGIQAPERLLEERRAGAPDGARRHPISRASCQTRQEFVDQSPSIVVSSRQNNGRRDMRSNTPKKSGALMNEAALFDGAEAYSETFKRLMRVPLARRMNGSTAAFLSPATRVGPALLAEMEAQVSARRCDAALLNGPPKNDALTQEILGDDEMAGRLIGY
jgi:hypothetical protein